MKYIYLFTLSLLFLFSCEDVVDVNLNQTEPKLTIEASINWFKGKPGNEQSIKLSLSAPFFNNGTPPANGATVTITDSKNTFSFIEDGNSGIYKTSDFIPDFNETYSLTVNYNKEEYVAKDERLIPVVKIDSVTQNNSGGFTGNEIELKAYFTDPLNVDTNNDGLVENNFYFFENINENKTIKDLDVLEDTLIDGNIGFSFISDEELIAEDIITIRNYGISERFYEFMFLLLQQGDTGGGPFDTQPATVKGNCVNTTNPANFPFGYFRLSEVDEVIYTVK